MAESTSEESLPREKSEAIPRFLSKGNALAVVAVTVASVVGISQVEAGSPIEPRLPFVYALAAVHVLMGTLGLYFVERRGTRVTLGVHFAAATAVVLTAIVLSDGQGGLMAMSLLSQSVLYLRRKWAAVVTGAVIAVVLGASAAAGRSRADLGLIAIGWVAGAGFVIVFSFMALNHYRARREVERLARELAEANARLKAYARDIEELVVVNERNRIARDIHDTVGHCLTVVHVQIDAAEALLRTDPSRAEAALEKARGLAHEGLREVRRSVAVLRGAAPAFRPIATALERLKSEHQAGGIDVRLALEGAPRPLSEPVEHTLYRAAQEALTNVRRHARASSVSLGLDFRAASRVKLTIEDDGVGTEAAEGGMGLVGIRERAELVGGSVSVRSRLGEGFMLEVEVPG